MKVYVVVVKRSEFDDRFDNVYGVYCTYAKAESIYNLIIENDGCPSIFITDLEGE